MTEDDTFNRLRRVDYKDIPDLMHSYWNHATPIYAPYNQTEIDRLRSLGWTELEYKKELRRDVGYGVDWTEKLTADIERLEDLEGPIDD